MFFKKLLVLFLSLVLFNTFANADCLTGLDESVLDKKLANSNDSYGVVKSPVSCHKPKTSYEKFVCSESKFKKLDLLALRTEIYNYENATKEQLLGKELRTYIKSMNWTQSTCKTKECMCKNLYNTDQLDIMWSD